MSGSLSELTRTGRLANVLCGLAGTGFTGLVYAEREDESLVITVRDGRPVFIEDLNETTSIPDALLEARLLTKAQYAEVATRVLESLTENEDIAFCQVAVELRYLSQGQVDSALERRIRGRLIQAMGWEQCRVEIDDDPESVTTILEYAQDVGSLIYMGVRTFFDDDRVRGLIGSDPELYARVLRPVAEVAEFFRLESEEAALLAEMRPEVSVTSTIEQSAADTLEGWQLVCMLLLAGMVELAPSPFPPNAERSGVRSAQSLEQGASGPDTARDPGSGSTSQARMPAVRAPGRPPSQGRMAVPREDPDERSDSQARIAAVREERIVTPGSRPRMPAPREQAGSQVRMPAAAAEAQVAPAARQGAPRPASGPSRAADAQREAPETPAKPQAEFGPLPPGRKRPIRKLSTALQRLDRELKQVRKPAPEEPAADPAAASHGRAHVDQLIRMRHANIAQKQSDSQSDSSKVAQEAFRVAQEALRENKFPRAYEHMRKACDAEPNNEIYSMYCMWASLRAGTLQEEGISKLRALLREKISDDQYKAFAYYALGHLSLVEKKDEAAEKFFRKAIELDKSNKDAERHLRVIELRRKTAATEQRGNKIFGIEIGIKKP